MTPLSLLMTLTTSLMVLRHVELLVHLVFQGHHPIPSLRCSASIFFSCISRITDCLTECYIDISPDEDECQAQAVSQIKGSSAPFRKVSFIP
jgi:hypothetical protein